MIFPQPPRRSTRPLHHARAAELCVVDERSANRTGGRVPAALKRRAWSAPSSCVAPSAGEAGVDIMPNGRSKRARAETLDGPRVNICARADVNSSGAEAAKA